MIKSSDFARAQGVTPRAVQKLFQKYRGELEGHYEDKGHNGTWFDEVAQDLLRSKMKQKPVVLYDASASPLLTELEELKSENKKLKEDRSEAYRQLAESREYQLQLQAQLAEQKLLAAGKAEAEHKAAEAELALEDMRREAKMRCDEAQTAEEQRAEAEERAKAAEDIAELNGQEAAAYKKYAEDLEAYLNLPFFKRLTAKKPTFDCTK